ncbi:hypothetical protein EV363DRAFT_1183029 [Boletus edulis]|nr:hypothetical protein EV363DRAFT_1183029 [Boletus edulis]
MVNTRVYVLPSALTTELRLRCRLYSSSWTRPHQVTVPTRCTDMSRSAVRFPVAESLFQDSSVQPYIHNCEVTVLDRQHVHRFRVFFKRHRYLPWNPSLSDCNHIFRGDVVVMRVGKGPLQAVVNMRARDSEVADYMISL